MQDVLLGPCPTATKNRCRAMATYGGRYLGGLSPAPQGTCARIPAKLTVVHTSPADPFTLQLRVRGGTVTTAWPETPPLSQEGRSSPEEQKKSPSSPSCTLIHQSRRLTPTPSHPRPAPPGHHSLTQNKHPFLLVSQTPQAFLPSDIPESVVGALPDKKEQ